MTATLDIHLLFITVREDNTIRQVCVTGQLHIPFSSRWAFRAGSCQEKRFLLPSPTQCCAGTLEDRGVSSPPPSKIRLLPPSDQHVDQELMTLLYRASAGIEKWDPELATEGEGGTYFLRSVEGEIIAVFKPEDEDPQAKNNPKRKDPSLRKRGKEEEEEDEDLDEDSDYSREEKIRSSIPLGKTALREVAAYRLDHGFAGVPATVLVEIDGWKSVSEGTKDGACKKIGSFQKFVPRAVESWDLGPSNFSASEVQKIGTLDLRILNTDRHGGNLLAVELSQKGSEGNTHRVVPIDHGYSLPTSFAEVSNFEWLYWPQARKPFSSELLEYIQRIDVEEDQALLKSMGIEEEALHVNKLSTLMLKAGANAGLNLYQIANLCRRRTFGHPSQMELACAQVEEQMKQRGVSFGEEYWCMMTTKIAELVQSVH